MSSACVSDSFEIGVYEKQYNSFDLNKIVSSDEK